MWSVVFVGFMQLIALKTRSAAATNSAGLIFFPLLFLTPNFVPRHLLTHPTEIAAINPVTYVEALRSLVLVDLDWTDIGQGFVGGGDLGALMLALNAHDQPLRLRQDQGLPSCEARLELRRSAPCDARCSSSTTTRPSAAPRANF